MKDKQFYVAPTMLVVEVLTEGKICTGSPANIDSVSDYNGQKVDW